MKDMKSQMVPGMESEMKRMKSSFSVGDRVKVKSESAHEPEMKNMVGTVKIIGTPALGIQFEGVKKIHKWYVDGEVSAAKPEEMNSGNSLDKLRAEVEGTDKE